MTATSSSGTILMLSARGAGSISHNNDWCVMMPIFHDGVLVGFSSIFGHMVDVGGKVPGSMPCDSRTIWEEGLRIPPVRIYDKGVLTNGVLDNMLNNPRTPDMNRADLMALIAGCRTAATRVRRTVRSFSAARLTWRRATCCSTARREAMKILIQENIFRKSLSPSRTTSTTKRAWQWSLQDDAFDLSARRDGSFRLDRTDPQAEGPINFHIPEGLGKLFFGVYMIMAFDPSVLFNEGFYAIFSR